MQSAVRRDYDAPARRRKRAAQVRRIRALAKGGALGTPQAGAVSGPGSAPAASATPSPEDFPVSRRLIHGSPGRPPASAVFGPGRRAGRSRLRCSRRKRLAPGGVDGSCPRASSTASADPPVAFIGERWIRSAAHSRGSSKITRGVQVDRRRRAVLLSDLRHCVIEQIRLRPRRDSPRASGLAKSIDPERHQCPRSSGRLRHGSHAALELRAYRVHVAAGTHRVVHPARDARQIRPHRRGGPRSSWSSPIWLRSACRFSARFAATAARARARARRCATRSRPAAVDAVAPVIGQALGERVTDRHESARTGAVGSRPRSALRRCPAH